MTVLTKIIISKAAKEILLYFRPTTIITAIVKLRRLKPRFSGGESVVLGIELVDLSILLYVSAAATHNRIKQQKEEARGRSPPQDNIKA